MGDAAIRAEGLGKRYRIGERQRYKTLRDTLTEALSLPFRRCRSLFSRRRNQNETINSIWALKDVSFEIKQGEIVGVIGRNGAGKSTLLKILSRIIEPTQGYVDLHGRVGSLLEVGTGFHPELTGRENVYLNGSILGMAKGEINCKFDEIVAFAEVEQFLDTPVKFYSTGMHMRLAFAVAAHLEPEILLVDEVLAVGDSSFQKKCLGKMGTVAKEGRTVLFVSHQMNQIRRLSTHCMWLDGGCVRRYGTMIEVVSEYETSLSASLTESGMRHAPKSPGQIARFVSWKVKDKDATDLRDHHIITLGQCGFSFFCEISNALRNAHHGIALWNAEGQLLWGWSASHLRLSAGVHELSCTLPFLPLQPGAYQLQVSLYEDKRLLDNWFCTPRLIIATDPFTHINDEWAGVLNVPCELSIRQIQ